MQKQICLLVLIVSLAGCARGTGERHLQGGPGSATSTLSNYGASTTLELGPDFSRQEDWHTSQGPYPQERVGATYPVQPAHRMRDNLIPPLEIDRQ